MYHKRRKEVIVRAWPRSTLVPALDDPGFDKWALSQLQLYKPFRTLEDLRMPNIKDVFSQYLVSGGFPHLRSQDDSSEDSEDVRSVAEAPDPDSESEFGTMVDRTLDEGRLRQDDYQRIMMCGRTDADSMPLLGSRELDLVHEWPHSWHDIDFEILRPWLDQMILMTVIPSPTVAPVQLASLSTMQRKAFDIIQAHTFGSSQDDQLLMVVVGTAGTGKSYLINAVRHLFTEHACAPLLKITAPTGIAAANIRGSTIYSLLSLMSRNLTGERLHQLQTTMAGVKLLIIDEYSFLSVAIIDKLHEQLHKIFPQSMRPFGGLNIVLCGDPAQLPPVLAPPVYAYRGSSSHQAARFHLFNKVVELDHIFRQAGDDESQIRFRHLLRRVANSEATEDDWAWLKTRRPSRLSRDDNADFDAGRYIVSTNDLRKRLNYERLSSFSPVIRIDECDAGMQNCPAASGDDFSAERPDHDDTQLFAIGAEVMLTFNLWTEAGLANGACGKIVGIVKPRDNGKARVVLVNIPNYCGPALLPDHPTVVPITQTSRMPGATKGTIPLTLAWAVTIHKAQGMTMDRVTVDLGRTEFASGLTFVALSRAKSFQGLRVHPFDLERYKSIEKGKYVEARREEFHRLRLVATATTI